MRVAAERAHAFPIVCFCLKSDTLIIDCRVKIVSSGFIDTHHHVWQTQSKGTHGDHLLLDYLGSGLFFQTSVSSPP